MRGQCGQCGRWCTCEGLVQGVGGLALGAWGLWRRGYQGEGVCEGRVGGGKGDACIAVLEGSCMATACVWGALWAALLWRRRVA